MLKIRDLTARALPLLAIAVLSSPASAQTAWTNTGTGDWGDSGNWDNGVPNSGSDAIITNSGTAVIGAGVSAEFNNLSLGNADGSSGNLELSGGSLAGGFIFVGQSANTTGAISVGSGSANAGSFTFLGFDADSVGTMTVSGGTWHNDNSGFISVGFSGTGSLAISGGLVETDNVSYIGSNEGASGVALVSGGTWTIAGSLYVGDIGTGSLTVSGGLVSANSTYVGNSAEGSGFLNLDGGILETTNLQKGSGSGALKFNGGILRALADSEQFLSNFGADDVLIDGGGALIDSGSHVIGIGTSLQGTGTLTKQGAGRLTLSGSSSNSGGTVVESGTLEVKNNDALGTGDATVGVGATLSILTGFTATNRVILEGGTLAQGFDNGADLANTLAATSHFDGGAPDTASAILAGAISASSTVTANFSPDSLASNDADRVSDVLTLGGLPAGNVFVLQLSMTEVGPGTFLGWLNGGDEWVNAAIGNTGFTGTFEEFRDGIPGFVLDDYVGAWGFTDTGVWAVVDHGGDYALVVPEPSAVALLLFGAGGVLLRRRRS